MTASKLQHSEIRIGDVLGQTGHVTIEVSHKPYNRDHIQLQTYDENGALALTRLSPVEAFYIGRALEEHAFECGFDSETSAQTPPHGI